MWTGDKNKVNKKFGKLRTKNDSTNKYNMMVITVKINRLNSLIIRHFHIEILSEISGYIMDKSPTCT